ncbi:putative divalent cation/proton antiporter TMEM165 isoform X2 [Ptychodera flava]|uniref:putative divalent cation/proton antiporter TMEM165 isoform X2 n=1 Tax=Ptychodera flava TaxID=63121 RepID=UPI00396AB123
MGKVQLRFGLRLFFIFLSASVLVLDVARCQDGLENQQAVPQDGETHIKQGDTKIQDDAASESKDGWYMGSVGFAHAFAASLSVIIVSELGDKTFFIAAIMAMRHSRLTVFSGAMLALGVMTALSAFLGWATTIIPRKFTYYASTALFAIFGLKMLKEGWYMSPDESQEEFEEVQAELKKKDEEREREKHSTITQDPESGVIRGGHTRRKCFGLLSPIFLEAFVLTFLAEWGDRSQITTIILAAREDVFGVTIGGCLGHALCTSLAVIGGRFIAQKISVRSVTLLGGVVFLIFAFSAFFLNDSSSELPTA